MKNKFLLGAVAGITSVAIAVPLLAQMSSAASATTTSSTTTSTTGRSWFGWKHTIPTQQQVTDMAAHDAAFLKNIDAFVTIQKGALEAHEAALTAAAAITDDTARDAAVKKANQDMRTTIEAAITANPDLKSAMMFGEHGGPGGHGPHMADLATKLGMTEAELKAAIDGGKTIQQIAQEKGITLPTPPMGMMGRGHGHWGPDNDNDGETNDDAAQPTPTGAASSTELPGTENPAN